MSEDKKALEAIKPRFKELVADQATVEREVSFALQAINRSEQLQKCSQASKQEAVLNVANIGLTLNPAMKLAYLVPRYDRVSKGMLCTLVPSYQGLIKLLTDSGSVTSCSAGVVREGDEYDYSIGSDSFFKHKPKLNNKGQIIAAYAVAKLHDGTQQVEIIDQDGLKDIKEASESYQAYKAKKIKSCVWVEWEAEMCRKSVIKRLSKYLPKTDRWEMVANAIKQDDQDYKLDAYSQKASYLVDLAYQIYGGNHLYEDIKNKVVSESLTDSEANRLIAELKDQYDPMIHDKNPSKTSIGKHIAEISKDQ